MPKDYPPEARAVFILIMTKEENEIADFILGLFTSTTIYQDDVYYALDEKYGYTYTPDPRLVVEILKDRGYIRTKGEAYFMLTTYGESYIERKNRKAAQPTKIDFEQIRKSFLTMESSASHTNYRKKDKQNNNVDKDRKWNKRTTVLGLILTLLSVIAAYTAPLLERVWQAILLLILGE